MILGPFFRNDRINNDVIIFRNMIIRTSNYLFIFNRLYVKFNQIQCTNTFSANYIHSIIYIYTCISSFNFVTRKKIKRIHRHKRWNWFWILVYEQWWLANKLNYCNRSNSRMNIIENNREKIQIKTGRPLLVFDDCCRSV